MRRPFALALAAFVLPALLSAEQGRKADGLEGSKYRSKAESAGPYFLRKSAEERAAEEPSEKPQKKGKTKKAKVRAEKTESKYKTPAADEPRRYLFAPPAEQLEEPKPRRKKKRETEEVVESSDAPARAANRPKKKLKLRTLTGDAEDGAKDPAAAAAAAAAGGGLPPGMPNLPPGLLPPGMGQQKQ